MIEIVGIIASLLILASMCFKTSSFKGTLAMRIINLIGSTVFVIYGIMLPAISTAFLNIMLVIVDGYYIIQLIKENRGK